MLAAREPSAVRAQSSGGAIQPSLMIRLSNRMKAVSSKGTPRPPAPKGVGGLRLSARPTRATTTNRWLDALGAAAGPVGAAGCVWDWVGDSLAHPTAKLHLHNARTQRTRWTCRMHCAAPLVDEGITGASSATGCASLGTGAAGARG